MKYCLIITSKNDAHSDYIINKWRKSFNHLTIQPVRLNTEDFLINTEITISPLCGFSLYIKDSNRFLHSSEIYSVWFRRPKEIYIPSEYFELSNFLTCESQNVLECLYYTLSDKLWLSKPQNLKVASNKLLQIKIAKQLGFDVLPTIISNNYEEVLQFCQKYKEVCVKALKQPYVDINKERFALLTRVLDCSNLLQAKNDIKFMPTQYQRFIDKKYDVRIVVFGEKIFPFAIYSQENDLSKIDFRGVQSGLRQELITINQTLKDKIFSFMRHFDINFSSFDFVVDNQNNFYFLENNPNGQWLWLELETNIDISSSLIRMLSNT